MEQYSFPKQFKCMYCKENMDPTGSRGLAKGETADLQCSSCGARWKFWVSIQLNQKLLEGGRFNQTKKSLVGATP